MTTTAIHPNATPVQPIYTKSGLTHIGAPTWKEQLGFDVVRLACSGKEVPATRFRFVEIDRGSVECAKCRKLAGL